MLFCCACMFVRPDAVPAETIVGGYAVCRRHVTAVGALLGRDWAAFLVMVGMPAHEAQNNPRPPGWPNSAPPPPHREPPPPTRPHPTTR